MSYTRDFANRVIDNRVVKGDRAKRRAVETMKKVGATAAFGLLCLGFYAGNINQSKKANSVETRMRESPRYKVTLDEGQTLSDCYKLEYIESGHGPEARYAFMKRSKENVPRRNVTVPDVDRDGYICGKIGTRVD